MFLGVDFDPLIARHQEISNRTHQSCFLAFQRLSAEGIAEAASAQGCPDRASQIRNKYYAMATDRLAECQNEYRNETSSTRTVDFAIISGIYYSPK